MLVSDFILKPKCIYFLSRTNKYNTINIHTPGIVKISTSSEDSVDIINYTNAKSVQASSISPAHGLVSVFVCFLLLLPGHN